MFFLFIAIATLLSLKVDAAETRILYIRHGETEANIAELYNGRRTDGDLTHLGRSQAELSALKVIRLIENGDLIHISAIYSSDLKRAQQTAQPLAKVLGLPVESRSTLREIDWGVAEGKSVHEWKKADEKACAELHPDRDKRWDILPGFVDGETYNQVFKRNMAEIEKIAQNHRGQCVVIVGHGRVSRLLIDHATQSDTTFPLPNGTIVEFIHSDESGLQFIRLVD